MQNVSDEALIALYRENPDSPQGQDAFASLMARYEGSAIKVLSKRLRDGDAAQDVFQAAFVKIWQNIDSFDPERGFENWFWWIIDNCKVDRIRTDSRQHLVTGMEFLDTVPDARPNQDVAIQHDELYAAFWAFVGGLPEPKREIAILIFVDQLTYNEASERLGVGDSTLKKRVASFRDELRDALGGELPEDCQVSFERRSKPREVNAARRAA